MKSQAAIKKAISFLIRTLKRSPVALAALAVVTQISCAGRDSSSCRDCGQPRVTEFTHDNTGSSQSSKVRPYTRNLVPGTASTRIQKLHGERVQVAGPNCWNAALMATGLVHSKRYVGKGEFWFWMSSPFCRKKEPNEPLKTGDIGSLYHESMGGFYHSFVVHDDRVFSKNSPAPEDAYLLQNYEDMFKPEFRERASVCKGTEAALKEKSCEFAVVHHECHALPANFYSRFPDLKPIHEEVLKIEKKLERYAEKRSASARTVLNPEFNRLRDLARQLKSKMRHAEKDLVVNAIGFRIIGSLLLDPGSNDMLTDAVRETVEKAEHLEIKAKNKYVPVTPDALH